MLSHASLAQLAAASYTRPLDVKVRDTGACFTTVGDEFVVAIPGTHDVANWITDLDAWPVWAKILGPFHSGFADDARALYRRVLREAPEDKTLTIVGHSLGGIIAQAMAVYMLTDVMRPCRVITFGAPRGAFFPNWWFGWIARQASQHAFYERRGDIVPSLPSTWLFRRAGKPKMIGQAVATLDPSVNHSISRYAADLAALGV